MSKYIDKAYELAAADQVDESTYQEIVELQKKAPESEEIAFAMILEGVSMQMRDEAI